MIGNVLRISALVGVAAVASCESYGDYSSLRIPDDAATSSTGGSGNANTGGTNTGNGGLIDNTGGGGISGSSAGGAAGLSGDGGPEDGAAGDASIEGGSGGSSSGGAAGASGGAGGSALDASKPGDVFDGGTLRAVPPLSTCGFFDQTLSVDGGPSHDVRTVDFGCPDIMQDFQFRTPPVVVGPGNWDYVAGLNPHIVQTLQAQSFVVRGVQAVVEGAQGIYRSKVLRDGKVTARLWSTDNDIGCLIARYQDEFHYYRLCMSGEGQSLWVFGRIAVNRFIEFQRGTANEIRVYPGHKLGLEFVGQTIRVLINDQVVFGPYEDPSGYSFGFVGFEAIVLIDANFDDLTIESY